MKVEIEITNEEGLLIPFSDMAIYEIEVSVLKYISIFSSPPPLGMNISYADEEPIKVNDVSFSALGEGILYVEFREL